MTSSAELSPSKATPVAGERRRPWPVNESTRSLACAFEGVSFRRRAWACPRTRGPIAQRVCQRRFLLFHVRKESGASGKPRETPKLTVEAS